MPSRLRPRQAVERMAPFHPPTGGRMDRLRLDFNENTLARAEGLEAHARGVEVHRAK